MHSAITRLLPVANATALAHRTIFLSTCRHGGSNNKRAILRQLQADKEKQIIALFARKQKLSASNAELIERKLNMSKHLVNQKGPIDNQSGASRAH